MLGQGRCRQGLVVWMREREVEGGGWAGEMTGVGDGFLAHAGGGAGVLTAASCELQTLNRTSNTRQIPGNMNGSSLLSCDSLIFVWPIS